jgi:hypothetical protein
MVEWVRDRVAFYGMKQDIPPDLIQDIQRIPTPFRRFSSAW